MSILFARESFWWVANRTLVLTSLVEGATGAYRDPIEALNARLAAYYR